ncbi:MAG: LuxR C-terminal-related transcriptional regulator [Cyanobacteria bacterium P01_D01_bin.105]
MPNLASRSHLDVSRLLFDLKRCGELMNQFTGCLEADDIARYVTDGLIEQFGCAFARIWLVEPDRKHLKLVASSGLYTRLDGSFAQVPMGAFKVGKIAQHCIPFLSNSLPDETWVKDRGWAINNNIKGFAGLPLIAEQKTIGVLAIFSHTVMAPEFLEVLQMLCLSVSGALASAINHAAYKARQAVSASAALTHTLSEQLAKQLGQQKLSLLGVERPLSSAVYQLLIQVAEYLSDRPCHYCRLVYDADIVVLEAMLSATIEDGDKMFATLQAETQQLGGTVQYQADDKKTVVEVRWQLPQNGEGGGEQDEFKHGNREPVARAPSPLSEREQQVLELLARGLRDREIAEKLFISERTVKFHTKNTLAKLDVKTRTHAVFTAAKQGWL